MESIKLHDLTFRTMIEAKEIEAAVSRVAQKINEDFRDVESPIVLGVLNGSFIFLSDLVRKFEFRCELCFVKLSSYSGQESTGKMRELLGLGKSIKGRNVIIVEDIVDTGNSIKYMLNEMKRAEVASVKVCTLFFKPEAYQGDAAIDYVAMNIGNEFIVGYGLDYNEYGRELKDIYVVDGE